MSLTWGTSGRFLKVSEMCPGLRACPWGRIDPQASPDTGLQRCSDSRNWTAHVKATSSYMLLGVSGSGLALTDTTGLSLTLWHRPTRESHPEWWQRMLITSQNILGPRNHRNGHIWDRFTSAGLIWQISTTNFLSRFVWSQNMVQAKCFALFVYLGYGFGCLAGKKSMFMMFISDLLLAAGWERNATTKEGSLRRGWSCIQRQQQCCALQMS